MVEPVEPLGGTASQTAVARLRGRPVFRKYLAVFVLLVGGALLASGSSQLFFSYQETQSALAAVQREKAASAAIEIQQFLGDIAHQVSVGIQTPGVHGPLSSAERREEYLRLLRQVPAISDLVYVDASGTERERVSRLALDIPDSLADYSRDPRFVEAQGGRTGFGPVYFRGESEPYLTLSIGEAGPEAGVTIAEVNLKFIWDVVSRIRVGHTGYAFVVDQRGQLVAHPDLALVLQRADLSELPQVRAALAGGSGAAEDVVGRDPQGRQVLTARAASDPPGWSVFVDQPVQEAFQPVYASVLRSILLLLIGLGLSAVASFVLARRMVRPIQALQAGAARVGAGALDQRIEVRTGDELEALAETFNAMSARLQASYAGLEQKVEARTRDLARALSELEAANHHKSAFLATMSHELRTPLNAIIGFAELLSDHLVGELNDRQARYVGHIITSGRHLLSLINDILDLSKVEAGRMELEVQPFALAETLEAGLLIVREGAHRRRITLSLDVDPAVGMVMADERKVKQVLFNLLSNAVKFTPEGGTIQVSGRSIESAGEVQVLVRDSGIGIAPAEQERIFEPFIQGGQSPERAQEGTGLGLALARSFVELHGGRIWVESDLGKGSTFGFALPVRPPQAATADPDGEAAEPGLAHVG
jgi:signal transduction histidine kinase